MKVDWATHEAAKFACEKWHYSRCLPSNKLVKIGVWEDNKFIGVIIYSCGASSSLGKRYNLDKQQVCELTRVALTRHITPVSRLLAISLKLLRKSNPGLRLVLSFADPRQGHAGTVYQANGWIYTGKYEPGGALEYLINGKWTHNRSVGAKFGYVGAELIEKYNLTTRKPTTKHRYLMPLDTAMREQISVLSKPYPKRASSVESGTSADQAEGGGESPTDALQSKATLGQT